VRSFRANTTMSKSKEKRIILATTFNEPEVRAIMQMFKLHDRGANIDDVLKSPPMFSLRVKFARLLDKARRRSGD